MSDTVTVVVPKDSWVDVSNAATDGLITNEGNRRIRLFEDATQPADADSKGHGIEPGDYMRYSLVGSQKVWAKSFGDQDSLVAITSE